MMKVLATFVLILFSTQTLWSQTIAEKKAGVSRNNSDLTQEMQRFLTQVNKELAEEYYDLNKAYAKVNQLYLQNAPDEAYNELLRKINMIQNNILTLENSWREMAIEAGGAEDYALWHQPETTLGQLIIDYGSQNFVYILSPDIASMPLSVDSNLPIPRSAWNEMIELILTQNGVGIKQLNPYLRQLYRIQEDRSNIQLITSDRNDLILLPNEARICFVLSPEPSEVRRVWQFLEKFVNPNSTVMQKVGRDILIIAPVGEIQDLLKLYDFVSFNRGDKEYKVISLKRVDADEMAKILGTIFDQPSEKKVFEIPKKGPPKPSEKRNDDGGDANGLRIIALSNIARALFLIGTPEEIRRAEEVIAQVEGQVGGSTEKVVFWYTAKHSDPEELAELLFKIYSQMMANGAILVPYPNDRFRRNETELLPPPTIPPEEALNQRQMGYLGQPYPPINVFDDGYYLDNRHIVDNFPDEKPLPKPANLDRDNFIVDIKTGAIVMVVEADALVKLKEVINKLDQPPKMVQIELLLFEKRVSHQNNIGLNLLRTGCKASNTNCTSLDFNLPGDPLVGITTFFLSRKKTDSNPAFDLIYQFLIAQEDITINSNPSVLAINQTPAKIVIEEEISVNTGVFEIPATGSVALKNAFARARYGTKIEITPTIHMADESSGLYEDSINYVTLDTDIVFETIQTPTGGDPSRPDVTRRMIQNLVRIPDGQTVILGGLRRKNSDDARESIPFIGELPGIGKLFSINTMADDSTEMYIFITPKIIVDPTCDLHRIRCQELALRPGDIPSFLCELEAAREWERTRLMSGTLTLLFGPEPERCVEGEYDGR